MTGRDPSSGSLGFHQLLFTIEEITGGVAYGTDQFQVSRSIPIGVQRAKGVAPAAGEQWLITKDLGPWIFAAIMNNTTTVIVEEVEAGTGIAVNNTDPTHPVVSNTGVLSVVAGSGISVDSTDPSVPVITNTGVTTVTAGTGISIDLTNPHDPIITNTGVLSVVAGTNVTVDNTNPLHPIVSSSGGSGGYVSLTGPGSASTPGDLTQLGGFKVTDSAPSSFGFQVQVTDNPGIAVGLQAIGPAGASTESSDLTLQSTGTGSLSSAELNSTGNVGINAGTSTGLISLTAANIKLIGAGIGFYGHAAASQPNVTGSRSSGVALTNLLTALAGLGLITNSTTT